MNKGNKHKIKLPAPKSQFPQDPDRAAEAGFTYGEAAPEKPGEQMETLPARRESPSASVNERAQRLANADRQSKDERNNRLERQIMETAEQVGPRGNYDD